MFKQQLLNSHLLIFTLIKILNLSHIKLFIYIYILISISLNLSIHTMINHNLSRTTLYLNNYIPKHKTHKLLLSSKIFYSTHYNISHIHHYTKKNINTNINNLQHLHINSNKNHKYKSHIISLLSIPRSQFSTKSIQNQTDYNSFKLIKELHNLPQASNKFQPCTTPFNFLSNQYPTITLDLQKKLQKIQSILHSPQKNLYKIVQETIIVLQAFAQANRRQLLQENAVKVVKQFGKKIVSAYLQNMQTKQLQDNQRKNTRKIQQETSQQNDNNYSLHQNYTTPPPDLTQKQFTELSCSDTIDLNFIFFYIETIKSWLLARIQTDSIIRQAEQEMYKIFGVRQVSALADTLKATLQNLIVNYIEQNSPKKRQLFPFDIKVRGIALLPFLQNKQHIQKYLSRLAEQNLVIYLKQSQIINIMYDVIQLEPNFVDNSKFVYQIQSTRVYQNLSTLNGAYIKALFINYTRKFMVSYQQIQFYQLFRDIQPKIRYPTIRTFMRLTQILNAQANDLHCEYNKVMNKYNYNILISIITTQTYTVENTKFMEFMELFQGLNKLEKSGQILYQQLSRFLKNYWNKHEGNLKPQQLQKIYNLFLHVIDQTKPIFKYQDKQCLNREYGRKTSIILNILFEILLPHYPQVVIIGNRFIKSYLLADDSVTASISVLPYDDRQIKIQIGQSYHIQNKINKISKIKNSFSKIIQNYQNLSLVGPKTKLFSTADILGTISLFLKINIQWLKKEQSSVPQNGQKQNIAKKPSDFKLLGNIYPQQNDKSVQQTIFNTLFEPLIKQYINLMSKQCAAITNAEYKQIYRNLFIVLNCINFFDFNNKKIIDNVNKYTNTLQIKVIDQIKKRLTQKQKAQQFQRTSGIQKLSMSLPRGNIELLLCLNQLIKFQSKTKNINQSSLIENHLSSTSISLSPSKFILESLPHIYNFINKIAIQNFKGIEQPDILNMMLFIKYIKDIKLSQTQNILLLEINTLAFEYLYQSLSVFITYLADRGKLYLRLTAANADVFIFIIEHFVANKNIFRILPSKKRLVVLQAILVGLIRKKIIKITSTHLKRSQHAKILLTFLQVFEYPQNLIMDMKKVVQEVEFLSSDLQEFSTDILERYSDMNWTISRFLDDNNVNLTSSKKLTKLSVQELRKQFEGGKSSKIYQMIVRNSKYQLPFELPEPKIDDANTKLVYMVQKIYQKISKRNNYNVPKNTKSKELSRSRRNKKQSFVEESFDSQGFSLEDNQRKDDDDEIIMDETSKFDSFNQTSFVRKFHEINLEQQKGYIKAQSLVNYIYEDHYKMSENRLPLHFKKQNWKNIYSISKQLQIQSLEIDQKIDQNIYKQVLLALVGYVEKVKIVAKEFHAHSFIQYAAAQLDMEVFYHGCIARISRKNKPQENVLFVCAVETNYKLLYICTHILRQSGQNAYIISDKTKDTDFKEFLQKLLPQPFQAEESEIVDKVVKGQIGIDGQDNGLLKQNV